MAWPARCCFQMIAVVALASPPSRRCATVRTIDDKSTSGTVRGFESGRVVAAIEAVRYRGGEDSAGGDRGDYTQGDGRQACDWHQPLRMRRSAPWAACWEVSLDSRPLRPHHPSMRKSTPPPQAVAAVPTPVAVVAAGRNPSRPVRPQRACNIQTPRCGKSSLPAAITSGRRWATGRATASVWGSIRSTVLRWKFPVERIRAIWSSSDALVKKAKDLNQSAPRAQDVVFIEKDNEVKSVAGVAAGIDGSYLKLKFEGEDRRIKLDRVVGVLLAQREIAPEKSLFEVFTLVRGARYYPAGSSRSKKVCCE